MKRLKGVAVPALLAVLGFAILVGTAVAQDNQGGRRRGGFGGRGGFGADPATLLGSPQVQTELDLIDEQKQEIDQINEEARSQMRSLFGDVQGLSREEQRAKFQELQPKLQAQREETQKKVNEVLLPHQQERLKQISLQLQGNRALSNPEVARELNITDAQQQKIRGLGESMRGRFQEIFAGSQGEGGREAAREKMTKLQEEMAAAYDEILNDEQRQRFTEMKGEPFELDRSQLRRGFGGRGRGERGGNQ